MKVRLFISVLFLAFILIFYALLIEPNFLEVTEYQFFGRVSETTKIAHLSDLHINNNVKIQQKVIKSLQEAKPDYIVITGDTIDRDENIVLAKLFFDKIRFTKGIYAVLGNWEHWSHTENKENFSSLGITLLVNQAAKLENNITLYGFDDEFAGTQRRDLGSLVSISANNFCISMFHSPSFFDSNISKCPLALSGHTHGGQVRLPFSGPIWLPKGSGKYISGWYSNDVGEKMYVSRGIGTSILPVRFLSRPEITYITINKTK